ncbi:hypothetical protein LguiB_010505 [Lonicera macranthoides]
MAYMRADSGNLMAIAHPGTRSSFRRQKYRVASPAREAVDQTPQLLQPRPRLQGRLRSGLQVTVKKPSRSSVNNSSTLLAAVKNNSRAAVFYLSPALEKPNETIKQVDVVISAVGHGQLGDQGKVINAIKEAGNVKRFFSSEFGNDADRTNVVKPRKTAFVTKAQIRSFLELLLLAGGSSFIETAVAGSKKRPSQVHRSKFLILHFRPENKVIVEDPTSGCTGLIVSFQQKVEELQSRVTVLEALQSQFLKVPIVGKKYCTRYYSDYRESSTTWVLPIDEDLLGHPNSEGLLRLLMSTEEAALDILLTTGNFSKQRTSLAYPTISDYQAVLEDFSGGSSQVGYVAEVAGSTNPDWTF